MDNYCGPNAHGCMMILNIICRIKACKVLKNLKRVPNANGLQAESARIPSDDTSSSPHQSNSAVVQIPFLFLGGFAHQHEALSIGDDF